MIGNVEARFTQVQVITVVVKTLLPTLCLSMVGCTSTWMSEDVSMGVKLCDVRYLRLSRSQLIKEDHAYDYRHSSSLRWFEESSEISGDSFIFGGS